MCSYLSKDQLKLVRVDRFGHCRHFLHKVYEAAWQVSVCIRSSQGCLHYISKVKVIIFSKSYKSFSFLWEDMTHLYVHLIVIDFFVFYMSGLIRHRDCRVLRIVHVNILNLTSSYQRLYHLLENCLMTFYCISSFSIFVVGLFINGKNKKKKLDTLYKKGGQSLLLSWEEMFINSMDFAFRKPYNITIA